MAQQEDFTKKFRRYFNRIGPLRFFLSLALIFLGIAWRYLEYLINPPLDETNNFPFETTGSGPDFNWTDLISFWPMFWAGTIVLSLIWWVLSGFKNITAVVVSLIAGILATEAMIPGTLFSREELPVYLALLGLFIFSLPANYYKHPSTLLGVKPPKKHHHKKRRKSSTVNQTSSNTEPLTHE